MYFTAAASTILRRANHTKVDGLTVHGFDATVGGVLCLTRDIGGDLQDYLYFLDQPVTVYDSAFELSAYRTQELDGVAERIKIAVSMERTFTEQDLQPPKSPLHPTMVQGLSDALRVKNFDAFNVGVNDGYEEGFELSMGMSYDNDVDQWVYDIGTHIGACLAVRPI